MNYVGKILRIACHSIVYFWVGIEPDDMSFFTCATLTPTDYHVGLPYKFHASSLTQ